MVEVAGLRPRVAASRFGLDVQTLARRDLVAQGHRLVDRLLRADPGVERRAAGAARHRRAGRSFGSALAPAVERIAQVLKRRAMIARGAHRDAPIGHGHLRIERGRLQERALRFQEPERVDLRDALVEELPRLLRRRGHRHVGLAHTVHQAGGKQRLGARRDRAQIGLRAGLSRRGSRDEGETLDPSETANCLVHGRGLAPAGGG